ncbi:MAG TPA: hypothetical protein PLX12_04095 [Flexilinea sp.]|nr:hypothetical protein [Flexilinea sp.]
MGKKKQMNSIGSGLNFGVDPEALDFSQDTWSWKGDIPNHPIQSDGFSYDIVDENEIDRNAISLGIIGMIIIVYNAKSAKIKEEDVLPAFREVIGTRNWNTISEKEANQMAKTAISKLVDEETSGDVFDLASYAPLEIKRVLLRKLFVIARYRLDPEYRTEAERRITEDIVPSIFADPQIELALLTGLIVKPKPKQEDKYTRQEEKAEESESVPSEEVPEIKGEEELIIPDRDAEEALQERLKTLSKDQPVKKAKKEKPTTEKPEEEYIPFSDMEKELAGSSSPAAEPFNDGFDEFNKPPIAPAEKIPAVKTGSQTQQPKPSQVPPPPMPNIPRPPIPPVPGTSHYPQTRPESSGYPSYPQPGESRSGYPAQSGPGTFPYPPQPQQPPTRGAYPPPPYHAPYPQGNEMPPQQPPYTEPPAIEHTQPRKPKSR